MRGRPFFLVKGGYRAVKHIGIAIVRLQYSAPIIAKYNISSVCLHTKKRQEQFLTFLFLEGLGSPLVFAGTSKQPKL